MSPFISVDSHNQALTADRKTSPAEEQRYAKKVGK